MPDISAFMRLGSLVVGDEHVRNRALVAVAVTVGVAPGIWEFFFQFTTREYKATTLVAAACWVVLVILLPARRWWVLVGIIAFCVAVFDGFETGDQPWPLIIGATCLFTSGLRRQQGFRLFFVCASAAWMAAAALVWPSFIQVLLGAVLPVLLLAWAGGEIAGRVTTATKQANRAARMLQHQLQDAILEERRRVARELHDGVARSLTAIHLSAGVLETASSVAAGDRARKNIYQLSEDSLKELADYVRLLDGGRVPPRLRLKSELRIEDELKGGVQRLRDSGRLVEFNFRVGPVTSATNALLVVVWKEAVSNIEKHSPSQARCTVQGRCQGDGFSLTVTNTVSGYPNSRPELPTAGVGLTFLADDIHVIGGQFSAGRDEDHWTLKADALDVTTALNHPLASQLTKNAWPVETRTP